MTHYKLESFGLRNYKSIKDSGEIKIPGISIFLGPNSSGKTNILESLILLKQSFDDENLKLNLNGSHIKLGEYRDIVHKKDDSKNIEFKFNFIRNNSETDENKDHECPICHNGYVYEGYYTNHLKDKHPEFWEKYENDISDFEGFLNTDSFFKLVYKFDQQSKSNIIHEIEFGNPPPKSGLFLSSLKLKNRNDGFDLVAHDIRENQILDISATDAEIRDMDPNEVNDVPKLIMGILYLYTSLEERPDIPWRFYRFPESGSDHFFPSIHERKEAIYEELYRYYDEDIETEQDTDSLITRLSVGLIGRINNIALDLITQIRMVETFLEEMTHIGPLRRNPQRIYFGSGGSPGQVYSQGENIEEMIFRSEQSEETPLLDQTNEWLRDTGFDVQLEISEVGVGDLYQVVVEEDGLRVNLADSGFGLSQTLPIIVQSVNMEINKDRQRRENQNRWRYVRRHVPTEYLMTIEQPEIHLNPRIEAALGDFFINVMKEGINLMIETHSEHLLNRIQRRIADGTIDHNDKISIYFVSKENNVSNLTEIDISSNGTFENWPEGFFQDDFDEAIEILKESLPE